jgi:hypothetical protein
LAQFLLSFLIRLLTILLQSKNAFLLFTAYYALLILTQNLANTSCKSESSDEPCGIFFQILQIYDIDIHWSFFFKLLLKETKKSHILGAIFLCIKHENFRSYAGETLQF